MFYTFHNLPDLSILGWEASPDAMTAVVNLINRHRDVLSLSTDTDFLNGLGVNDLISYFEHNPLKYWVLVVDANRIKAMIEQKKGVNPKLLQTADRTVGKFFLLTRVGQTYLHGCGEHGQEINNNRKLRINLTLSRLIIIFIEVTFSYKM